MKWQYWAVLSLLFAAVAIASLMMALNPRPVEPTLAYTQGYTYEKDVAGNCFAIHDRKPGFSWIPCELTPFGEKK